MTKCLGLAEQRCLFGRNRIVNIDQEAAINPGYAIVHRKGWAVGRRSRLPRRYGRRAIGRSCRNPSNFNLLLDVNMDSHHLMLFKAREAAGSQYSQYSIVCLSHCILYAIELHPCKQHSAPSPVHGEEPFTYFTFPSKSI